jgi:hypothetical protein
MRSLHTGLRCVPCRQESHARRKKQNESAVSATSRRGFRIEHPRAPFKREASAPALFSENEQSPQFCGRAIVNNWKTKGHAGVTPRGLQRDCPPRPSRDSVSRRIMCGRSCLSSPRANYPQFRRAGRVGRTWNRTSSPEIRTRFRPSTSRAHSPLNL